MRSTPQFCDLCGGDPPLEFQVSEGVEQDQVGVCKSCLQEMELMQNPLYWRCLSTSIWSESLSVKIYIYHLLDKLPAEAWILDLKDQIYLSEDERRLLGGSAQRLEIPSPKDSNGQILAAGDSVTLIKDLNVKGANFTAKRGTLVKNISLTDDPESVEGKIGGTQIVLKTCFLKKA